MNFSLIKRMLVLIIIVAMLGFVGYSVFIKAPDLGIFSSNPVPVKGQDILALAGRLKNISIDQSFFSSPLFRNLKDFEPTPFEEPKGRANPFATIGVESSAFQSSATKVVTAGPVATTTIRNIKTREF